MKTPVCLIAALVMAAFNFSTTVVQAQFNFTTNNGTITITRYAGSGGAVTIPETIDGVRACLPMQTDRLEAVGLTNTYLGMRARA